MNTLNNITLNIATAFGVEAITKRELKNFGFDNLTANAGNIEVNCKMQDIAKLNINLRTADRIYLKLGEFKAESFDDLFEGILKLDLSEIIEKNAKLIISAKSFKSVLFALSSIQSISKKAIIENLKKSYSLSEYFETGNEFQIEIQILNNNVKVLLNTSGLPLHKRGYRELTITAPIKETLAAAIVLNSFWSPKRILADPFCGSGTILIEAAMIASNIAPGINRDFDFLHWNFFDKKLFDLEKENAISKMNEFKDNRETSEKMFTGSDIDNYSLKIAEICAKKAGVNSLIDFSIKDAKKISSSYKNGIIITNPPYGERLLSEKEITLLYREFFESFKKMDNWNLYFLTSYKNTEKIFKKRADKIRKFFNGNLECYLYQYFSPPPQTI